MARMFYTPEVKAKILAASKGKSIKEAFHAASKVGFKGSPQSLYVMLRNSGVRRRRRGRKPSVVNASTASTGLSQIDQIVDSEVQSRVNAAARAAIRELEKLIK